jgi:hypothetical protein
LSVFPGKFSCAASPEGRLYAPKGDEWTKVATIGKH